MSQTSDECCRKGNLHTGTAKGEWGTLGNLKAYITGNQSLHEQSYNCTMPLELLFQMHNFLQRLDARVFFPDFFDGEHIPFDFFSKNEVKIDPNFDLQGFIGKNGRPNKLSTILQAVRDIKSLHGVEKLGVVGFCWGGWGSFAMGSQDEVDAVVIAHPGGIEYPDDFEKCSKPVLFLCPEHDPLFPDEHRDNGKKILDKNGIWNKLVIFKGAEHGFATRGNENNDVEAKAMEEAKEEVVSFFGKFLT